MTLTPKSNPVFTVDIENDRSFTLMFIYLFMYKTSFTNEVSSRILRDMNFDLGN